MELACEMNFGCDEYCCSLYNALRKKMNLITTDLTYKDPDVTPFVQAQNVLLKITIPCSYTTL